MYRQMDRQDRQTNDGLHLTNIGKPGTFLIVGALSDLIYLCLKTEKSIIIKSGTNLIGR